MLFTIITIRYTMVRRYTQSCRLTPATVNPVTTTGGTPGAAFSTVSTSHIIYSLFSCIRANCLWSNYRTCRDIRTEWVGQSNRINATANVSGANNGSVKVSATSTTARNYNLATCRLPVYRSPVLRGVTLEGSCTCGSCTNYSITGRLKLTAFSQDMINRTLVVDDTVARKEPVTPREAFSFQPVSTVNLSDWSTSVRGRACSLANREVRIGYVHLVHCNTTKRYASVGNQVSTHVAEVCYTVGITTYRVTAIVLNTVELNISRFHTDVSHGVSRRMAYEGQAICFQAVNIQE